MIANTLAYLDTLELPESVRDRLKVVTIGGIENPDGGLWQRLAWLRFLLGDPIPILDLSFEPGMAVDTGITSTTIGFEYDPVVYAPRYWGNLLAVLNMIAAFDTVHGYYLSPNGNDETATLPYGYTPSTPEGPGTLAPQLNCDLNPTNCRTDSYGNTYITVPATSLPLTNLIRSLADSIGIGKLAKPFIDLWEPILTVMVDLGFDWSGDPGVTRSSTILPFKIFQNWFKVGVDLAVATVKGIEAFLGNFGIDSAATRLRVAENTELADNGGSSLWAAAEDEPTEAGGTPQDDSTAPSEEVAEADATEDVVAEEADATEDTVTEDEVVTEEGEETAEEAAEDEVTQEDEVVTQQEDEEDEDVTADQDAADDDTDTDTDSDDSVESDTRAAA